MRCLSAVLALSFALLPVTSAFAQVDLAVDYPDWRQQLGEPNPASLSFYGPGRLQLPSLRADIGSTLSTDRLIKEGTSLSAAFADVINKLEANQSLGTDADELKVNIDTFLTQFETPSRLDYDLDVNLLSFGGAPFSQIQIADRPLSFGVSLSSNTRGYLQARFSEGFNDNLKTLTASLPDLLATGSSASRIIQNAGSVTSQVTTLSNDINELLVSVQQFQQAPLNNPQGQMVALSQRLSSVNSQVKGLLPSARELTGLVSSTTTASRSLLSSLQAFSDGGAQITAAADTHLTLGVSTAYPVFENESIKVSLGGRVKLFMMPFNVPLENLNIQSQAGVFGKLDLTEVTGLKSTTELNETLNNFDKTTEQVNQILDRAEKVSESVEQVQVQLNQNNLTAAAAQGASLAQDGVLLANELGTVQSSVQQAVKDVQAIQDTLLNEIQDISYKGTLTTPSGAGMGIDLGVDALLYRYLRLGLQVQNPLVLWPGTERPFEGRLVRNQGGQIQIQPSLTVDDDQEKSVNYTATVPLTILFNARYRFDGVLKNFPGLYATSRFEYVANGRTPAFQLGFQKFFNEFAYAGLGGRLGGVGSLVYLEAGANPLEGFIFNAQLGINPAGQGIPAQGLGWLGLAQLGMAYRF